MHLCVSVTVINKEEVPVLPVYGDPSGGGNGSSVIALSPEVLGAAV